MKRTLLVLVLFLAVVGGQAGAQITMDIYPSGNLSNPGRNAYCKLLVGEIVEGLEKAGQDTTVMKKQLTDWVEPNGSPFMALYWIEKEYGQAVTYLVSRLMVTNKCIWPMPEKK